MRARVRRLLQSAGLYEGARRLRYAATPGLDRMEYPPYSRDLEPLIASSGDPVRYRSVALALHALAQEGIEGTMAEVGVYKGDMSRFLRAAEAGRKLYLFDTFEGFPDADLHHPDSRFRDTSISFVRSRLGNAANVEFRAGYFPETTRGLEDERFAFVLLDLDLYAPMLAGLEYFYPRLAPGGYLMLHDYNNPESDRAVSRAADAFFVDHPERLIGIPDRWGTVVTRKI